MAISIPSFGGIISRITAPFRAESQATTGQPNITPDLTTTTTPQRLNTINEINVQHRASLTPDQALRLDKEYVGALAPDHPARELHPNTREATTDEIVGSRYLRDPDWYRKNDPTQDDAPPLYGNAEKNLTPTTDKGEGKI